MSDIVKLSIYLTDARYLHAYRDARTRFLYRTTAGINRRDRFRSCKP